MKTVLMEKETFFEEQKLKGVRRLILYIILKHTNLSFRSKQTRLYA